MGEVEKISFIAFQANVTTVSSCPQTLCPIPEKIVRSFLLIVQGGHDQWWTFLSWVGGEVTGNQHHQPSGSNWSGIYMLVCCAMVSRSVIACQAPLSMAFPMQEYWSWFPCLPPCDLPNTGIFQTQRPGATCGQSAINFSNQVRIPLSEKQLKDIVMRVS